MSLGEDGRAVSTCPALALYSPGEITLKPGEQRSVEALGNIRWSSLISQRIFKVTQTKPPKQLLWQVKTVR